MKTCSVCRVPKPFAEFYADKRLKDGHSSRCRECSVKATRASQKKNPEAKLEADRRYRQTDAYKDSRKARRDGPQGERIREQKRESWVRNREKNNEKQRRYLEAHRDEINAQRRARYAADPERVRSRNRAYMQEHRAEERARHLRRRYRLTAEEFDAMRTAQGNLCAICGCEMVDETQKNGRIRTGAKIDHDHASGFVRGLLCSSCNMGIGQLGDDPARLRAAIAYLEAHRAA